MLLEVVICEIAERQRRPSCVSRRCAIRASADDGWPGASRVPIHESLPKLVSPLVPQPLGLGPAHQVAQGLTGVSVEAGPEFPTIDRVVDVPRVRALRPVPVSAITPFPEPVIMVERLAGCHGCNLTDLVPARSSRPVARSRGLPFSKKARGGPSVNFPLPGASRTRHWHRRLACWAPPAEDGEGPGRYFAGLPLNREHLERPGVAPRDLRAPRGCRGPPLPRRYLVPRTTPARTRPRTGAARRASEARPRGIGAFPATSLSDLRAAVVVVPGAVGGPANSQVIALMLTVPSLRPFRRTMPQ